MNVVNSIVRIPIKDYICLLILENCLTDIYTWMSQNKLKLNADKTEVLVMGTPQMRAKSPFLVLP